jgi:hypothetical protein
MTATNHVVTGALLATFITNPVTALPLAFLLHFLLDALPHFGRISGGSTTLKFKAIIFTDMIFATAFLLSIVILQPSHWLLLAGCGVVCSSPDLMWLPRWINELRGKKNRPLNKVEAFHSNIQWGERPWGWVIELAWFFCAYAIFLQRTAI